MALRDNSCCGGYRHDHCEEYKKNCYTHSSEIIYDGETFEEAGLRHGDTLNNALYNLALYVSRSINASGEVRKETFDGTTGVRLSEVPAQVLQVSYCGAILPDEYYRAEGKTIKFCKDFCRSEDGFASVQVIYRVKADSTFGFRC